MEHDPDAPGGVKSFPRGRTRCSGCGASFEYTTALLHPPRYCWNCAGGEVDWWEDAGDAEDAVYWVQDRGWDPLSWSQAFAPMRDARVVAGSPPFESPEEARPVAWLRRNGWTPDHYSYDGATTVCTVEIPASAVRSHVEFGRPCLNCQKRLARGE